MSLPRLMLLSNQSNEAPEEDRFLASELASAFDVEICEPFPDPARLKSFSIVLIRNVWPTWAETDKWVAFSRQAQQHKIKTYNPLVGKADFKGKKYLVELCSLGYQVIPSVDSLADLHRLPASQRYWIKPIFGADGHGARQLNKAELTFAQIENCIIQPLIEFSEEPSFFFLDNKFLYAISQTNRLTDSRATYFSAEAKEINLAKRFIEWNALPCGLVRVDFARLANGELLLMEIEDFCPFLYLLDLSDEVRRRVVTKLTESVLSQIEAPGSAAA